MKKHILMIFLLIFIFTLVGCGSNNMQEEENGQDYFNAKVLEVHEQYVQVECLEVTTGAITEGTPVSVTKDIASANEVPEMEVGDEIRVVFSGVMESYPPQLSTVFAIYLHLTPPINIPL